MSILTKSGLVARPLILCGPSGCGKSTLIAKLQEEFPGEFGFSVSHTTRGPREGEKDAVHYFFSNREEMEKIKAAGGFLENAEVHGNMYGTSRKAVDDVTSKGQICILDIDIQGTEQVRKTDLNPRYCFVKPPSMEILEHRLRARGTETEEKIQLRLKNALKEMEYCDTHNNFDLVLVNDDLEAAYQKLREFVKRG